MDAIQIYLEIKNGKRRQFPQDFWSGVDGKIRAREVSKYVLEVELELTEDNLAEKLRYDMFYKKLGRMLKVAYNGVLFNMVNDVYPNRYNPWELNCVSMGFYNKKENRRKVIEWLKDKYDWCEEDFIKKINVVLLKKEKLIGLLNFYNESLFNLVQDNVNRKIMPWELQKVKKGLWQDKENAKKAMLWLIEKKGWDEEEFKKEIGWKVIIENGLKGLLCCRYDGNVYNWIVEVFPNKFKPSDFKRLNISKEIENPLEEKERGINDIKKRYHADSIKVGKIIKDAILESALNGKSECFIPTKDIPIDNIHLLGEQGFDIWVKDDKYHIKW